MPASGKAHECKTSVEADKKRIGTFNGNTKTLSTLNKRGKPITKSVSDNKKLSNSKDAQGFLKSSTNFKVFSTTQSSL